MTDTNTTMSNQPTEAEVQAFWDNFNAEWAREPNRPTDEEVQEFWDNFDMSVFDDNEDNDSVPSEEEQKLYDAESQASENLTQR